MLKEIKYGMLLFLIATVGCSRTEEEPAAAASLPLFLTGETFKEVPTSDTMEEEPLPAGVNVGVWAIDRASGAFNAGNDKCNALYLSDGSGAVVAAQPPMLDAGHDYSVYAYAPRTTEDLRLSAGDALIPVNHAVDVLYSPAGELISVSEKNHTVSLRFAHRMAQVKFTLVAAEGNTLPDGVSFSVTGFYRSAVMSVVSGTFTERSDPDESVSNVLSQTETEPVCIIPDKAVHKLSLTVESNGGRPQTKSFNYLFEAGCSYRFIIRYSASSTLEIMAAVVPWTTIDGGSIDIQG